MRNFNARISKSIAMALVVVTGLFFLSACSEKSNDKSLNIDFENSSASEQKYPKSVDSSKSMELTQDISEIDIGGTFANVNIIFASRNDIASSLKGEFEVSDSQLQTELAVEKNGDRIDIAEKHNSKELNVKNNKLQLRVEIPDTFTGKLKIKTVSGDVLYQCGDSMKNDINIESVSGRVEAQIPENAGFILKCTTTTGSVKNDFNLGKDGGAVGDKKHNIEVKTVTGAIKILKK